MVTQRREFPWCLPKYCICFWWWWLVRCYRPMIHRGCNGYLLDFTSSGAGLIQGYFFMAETLLPMCQYDAHLGSPWSHLLADGRWKLLFSQRSGWNGWPFQPSKATFWGHTIYPVLGSKTGAGSAVHCASPRPWEAHWWGMAPKPCASLPNSLCCVLKRPLRFLAFCFNHRH